MILKRKLEVNDIVDIYTDYRNLIGYEGQAILLERVEKGHSFICNDDKLLQKEEDNPQESERIKNLKIYNELIKYTEVIVNKDLQAFVRNLKKFIKTNYKFPEKVKKYIDDFRINPKKNVARGDELRSFFEKFSTIQILKFFYQKHVKEFSLNVYRDEVWKVKFLAEQYDIQTKKPLHYSEFTTKRRIARIEVVCPNDDAQTCEMIQATTDNTGLSNKDRDILRKRKQKKLSL